MLSLAVSRARVYNLGQGLWDKHEADNRKLGRSTLYFRTGWYGNIGRRRGLGIPRHLGSGGGTSTISAPHEENLGRKAAGRPPYSVRP